MRLLAAVTLIALLSAPALAQPPGAVPPQEFDTEQPFPQAQIERPVQLRREIERKDPAIGVGLALLGTVGSFALAGKLAESDNVVAGLGVLVIGPSVGQWYSHQVGGIGITMRLTASYLILRAFQSYEDERGDEDDGGYILAGIGLWVGSTIYDLWAASDAAHTYNREQELRFAPTMMRATNGAAPGVAASLRF